jgi:type I restriction enzyme, S subunit
MEKRGGSKVNIPLKRIKYVAQFQYGDALAAESREDGQVPIFGSNGAFGFHSQSNTLAPVVVIGRKGSYGKVTFSKEPGYVIDTAYFVDRRHSPCDLRWLFWTLQTANLDHSSQDTGVPGLSREIAHNAVIPVPDFGAQRKIAEWLDERIAKIDQVLNAKDEVIARYRTEKTSAITILALGKDHVGDHRNAGDPWIGTIPSTWGVRKLQYCSERLTNGYVGPTRDILQDEGVRYLQSLHIKDNKILFNDPYFVSQAWSLEHRRSILRRGDVLIVQTGDIGQVASVPDDFVGCNCHALIIARPLAGVMDGDYLSWVLNSSYGEQAIKLRQTGALHPHLNCGNVKDILLPTPTVAEQRDIVRRIEQEVDNIRHKIALVEQSVSAIRTYRQSLITAAVTGQVSPP